MPFLDLTFALNIACLFSAKVDWKGSLTGSYKEYSWQKRLAFGAAFPLFNGAVGNHAFNAYAGVCFAEHGGKSALLTVQPANIKKVIAVFAFPDITAKIRLISLGDRRFLYQKQPGNGRRSSRFFAPRQGAAKVLHPIGNAQNHTALPLLQRKILAFKIPACGLDLRAEGLDLFGYDMYGGLVAVNAMERRFKRDQGIR